MGIDEAHYTGKDNVPVPTQEERLAALERKVAMLELLRSQDERKADEALPPADRKSTRLNSSHRSLSRMPSSA